MRFLQVRIVYLLLHDPPLNIQPDLAELCEVGIIHLNRILVARDQDLE